MSTGTNPPFSQAGIVTLAASTTSAGAALPAAGDTLLVTNPTTALAWLVVGSGSSAPTAAAGTGYPVLPGQRRFIGVNSLISQVAVILSAGTGSVYVEIGTGSAA